MEYNPECSSVSAGADVANNANNINKKFIKSKIKNTKRTIFKPRHKTYGVFGSSPEGLHASIEQAVTELSDKIPRLDHITFIDEFDRMISELPGDLTDEDMARVADAIWYNICNSRWHNSVIVEIPYSMICFDGKGNTTPSIAKRQFPLSSSALTTSGKSYKVFFEDARAGRIDGAIYIATDPKAIFENLVDPEFRDECVSVEDVMEWQNFELREMKRICQIGGIPLIVIHSSAGYAGRAIASAIMYLGGAKYEHRVADKEKPGQGQIRHAPPRRCMVGKRPI